MPARLRDSLPATPELPESDERCGMADIDSPPYDTLAAFLAGLMNQSALDR